MQATRWLPVLAGGVLAAAAPLLWWLQAPEALPYASALAGITLILVGWPQRATRNAPLDEVGSWAGLARDLHLQGAVADPAGRLFLPSRPGQVPPLDDGRSLYDGADGYVAGVALSNPMAETVARFAAADPARLKDAKAFEEDLNALGAWTGWMRNVRLLPTPAGPKVRWDSRLKGAAAAPAIAWLVAAALARGSGRRIRVATVSEGEAACEWVA